MWSRGGGRCRGQKQLACPHCRTLRRFVPNRQRTRISPFRTLSEPFYSLVPRGSKNRTKGDSRERGGRP